MNVVLVGCLHFLQHLPTYLASFSFSTWPGVSFRASHLVTEALCPLAPLRNLCHPAQGHSERSRQDKPVTVATGGLDGN